MHTTTSAPSEAKVLPRAPTPSPKLGQTHQPLPSSKDLNQRLERLLQPTDRSPNQKAASSNGNDESAITEDEDQPVHSTSSLTQMLGSNEAQRKPKDIRGHQEIRGAIMKKELRGGLR